MKRFIYTVCLVIICLFTLNLTAKPDDVTLLTGIHENGKLYDFWEISELYKTIPHPQEIEKSVDEIAKFAYSRYNSGNSSVNPFDSIVINLQNQTLFTEPKEPWDLRTSHADYKMTDEELQYVKSLIESYDVLSWGSDAKKNIWGEYENKSGYWELMLQFNDGTVVLLGNTTHKEGHGEFVDELYDFIGSKERNVLKDFSDIYYQARFENNANNILHKPEDITKIIYLDYVTGGGIENEIFINIKDKVLFTYPLYQFNSESANADYLMTNEEVNEFIQLAEKYNICSWESQSGEQGENPHFNDKQKWLLILQFSDHSLHIASGIEIDINGQQEFGEEIRKLKNSKIPNR